MLTFLKPYRIGDVKNFLGLVIVNLISNNDNDDDGNNNFLGLVKLINL